MNKVPLPNHSDLATLTLLRETPEYDQHTNELDIVKNAYANYTSNSGNASRITPLTTLPDTFKNPFRGLYNSTRDELVYIELMRRESLLASCPMGGSASIGTIDHLLPKEPFPEFSIFSKNLVPACAECNNKKGDNYLCNTSGGRVLHPYYDNILSDRLIYTIFNPRAPGLYDRPIFDIGIIDPAHPNYNDIKFHIETVIINTPIFTKQIVLWNQMLNSPDIFIPLKDYNSVSDLTSELSTCISKADREFQGKNNWKSMFFSGLAADTAAMDYLIHHWQRPVPLAIP